MLDSESITPGDLAYLVVDDSQSMRRIIVRTVRGMGAQTVHEAADVAEAWCILGSKPVDFIICDWNMPGQKGIDLLKDIRGQEKYRNIPFLMVSAEARTENIFEAIRSGVSNYLPKPFTPEILVKKIEAILESRHSHP